MLQKDESPILRTIENEKIETLDNFYMTKIQSNDNLRRCRQFINDLFVSSVGDKMKFVERRIYQIGKNLNYNREIHFIAEQSFSLKYESLVNSMNNKLNTSEWRDHELMRYFKPECAVQVGQRLESLPDLEKLNGEKAIRNFSIEEGRIWIIYIWTIYKSICKKQLKLLNDLCEKHLEWEGSVKILSINTDINREYATKSIKLLHLPKIEHLYIDATKYPNHPLFNVVNKCGYPVCILVNNDNLIDLCGSLYEIDLERKIHNMLNRESATNTNFFFSVLNNNGANLSQINYFKKIINTIEKKCDNLKDSLSAPHLCGATLKVKKVYTTSSTNMFLKIKIPEMITQPKLTMANRKMSFMNKFSSKKLPNETLLDSINKLVKPKPIYKISYDLDYYCHPDDSKIFDELFGSPEQGNNLNFVKNFVRTFEIGYAHVNVNCSICDEMLNFNYFNEDVNENENEIGNENKDDKNADPLKDSIDSNDMVTAPQYHCLECNLYFCKKCGDSVSNLNNPDKVHNHFLYFLTPNNKYFLKYILAYNHDNTYEFDFKYFQENKKTDKFISDIKCHYQVKCDGCLEFPIRTVRWKCCNCIYKNICDGCKYNVDNKVKPYYESIIYNFERDGCDIIQHVFMKIIFDSYVY